MESPSINLLDLVDLLKGKWGKPTSFERNGMTPKRQKAFDEGWKQALEHVLDDLSDVIVLGEKCEQTHGASPTDEKLEQAKLQLLQAMVDAEVNLCKVHCRWDDQKEDPSDSDKCEL